MKVLVTVDDKEEMELELHHEPKVFDLLEVDGKRVVVKSVTHLVREKESLPVVQTFTKLSSFDHPFD